MWGPAVASPQRRGEQRASHRTWPRGHTAQPHPAPTIPSLTLLLLCQPVDRPPRRPKAGGHLLQRAAALGQAVHVRPQAGRQGLQLTRGEGADVNAALGQATGGGHRGGRGWGVEGAWRLGLHT